MNRNSNNLFADAGSSATSNRRFNYEDDDDSSYKFGTKFGSKYASSNDPTEEYAKIQEKIGRVENESLDSTRRALRMLNETEEIGVKTAEELVRQGEKLENVNSKLDDVDQTLNATQKNINQIKSVFGGIKNKFFGGGSSSASKSTTQQSEASKSSSMPSSKSLSQINANNFNRGQQNVITGSDREKEINNNLDEMSLGLSRLRNLAHDMSFELDRQNPIIDQLNDKTVRTKVKIEDQNTQIKRVLK